MPDKIVTVEKRLVWDGPHCENCCQFLDEEVDVDIGSTFGRKNFCARYVDVAGYHKPLKCDKLDTDWRCFRCESCLKENP